MMYLDKTIGELVTYLEEEGWMENSIIALASDNGGCPTAGGSNYPLRGMKHSYWEGGVKVWCPWGRVGWRGRFSILSYTGGHT